MTARSIILAGTFLGLISVIIGAMADHALGSWGLEHRVQTALHYQQIYSVLVTALGLALNNQTTHQRWLKISAWLFITGTIIFSSALYMADAMPILVYLTPIGGALLMAGWIVLGLAAVRRSEMP